MRPEERTPAHVAKHREARRKGWEKRWAAMSDPESTIVAEVSANWRDGEPLGPGGLICSRFESVIAANAARGYRLRDWQLSRLVCANGDINETIIAVFERRIAKRGGAS